MKQKRPLLRPLLPLPSSLRVRPRGSFFSVLLFCALVLFGGVAPTGRAAATAGQSGRRTPKPSERPQPSPTPPAGTTAPGAASTPAPGDKKPAALLSLIIFEFDNQFLSLPFNSTNLVLNSFAKRLSESPDVSFKIEGKLDRKGAIKRAKAETESHVVLVQLEEESAIGGRESIGQVNPATIAVKVYVYAPVEGTLKMQDRISQRIYRPTTSVGGVRVPLPVPQRGRTPIEDRLEQAGRDAADRLMSKFSIRQPPETR